jgi:hypothetical protein
VPVQPTIGVSPASALRERARLFAALSAVFSVQFEQGDDLAASGKGLDAVIAIGCPAPGDAHVPALEYVRAEDEAGGRGAAVEFAGSGRVDSRLRGRQLYESRLPDVGDRLTDGEWLARDHVGPLWAVREDASAQVALVAPSELAEHETLRDRFSAGRFVALLPLVELLRRVTDYGSWTRPGPRATFLFDDPNLRWPSYGYIRFAELARHALAHDYHAAIALVPFDSWSVSKRAVQTFRDAPSCLSLAMHGNDHTYAELAVDRRPDAASALFEQAVARIERFEGRTGLHVSRVMIPPHGLSSDEMLDAMVGARIEALCRAPGWWHAWPRDRASGARWGMADMSPAGAPVLGRHPLRDANALDDATLDLYLDQPAILYGHHYDVADGYDGLARAAEWLNGVEGLSWGSCELLARTNVMTRVEGDVLRVRTVARIATVTGPPGVRRIDVELPAYDRASADRLVCGDVETSLERDGDLLRASFELSRNDRPIEIRMERIAERPTARSGTSARAAMRRSTGELRDRAHPLVRRLGLERTLGRLERAYRSRARSSAR